MFYYSPSTNQRYVKGLHKLPADVIEITDAKFSEFVSGELNGKLMQAAANGEPVLVDRTEQSPTADNLCTRIDIAADAARIAVAGDPLRAVEYDRARIEAEQFAAASYHGDVPPMVAAWAINGRTAQEAADDILREAAQYTAALIVLRETRLAAKEQVRALMDADEVEQAQQVVEQTIAAIEAAVSGIGNAK